MKKIGKHKRDSRYILVELGEGDTVHLSVPNPKDAALITHLKGGGGLATGKIGFTAIGGVTLLGASGPEQYLFLRDPRWTAAILKAVRNYLADGSPSAPPKILIRPLEDREEAISYLIDHAPEYTNPNFAFGDRAWEPYAVKDQP